VTVIDSETDVVIDTITVKLNPSSLAITNDGNLLIGCPIGIIYEFELSEFSKIDSFEIAEVGFGKDIWVDKKSDMIYFTTWSNAIAGLNTATKESSIAVNDTTILFTYGYAFDYISGNHYLTDA
jgi:DNA-binding beta-propeller fold protein YncE